MKARLGQTFAALGCAGLLVAGCQKFESWLFERNSPTVDRAVHAIETHDAGDAHRLLAEYLSTGRCKAGSLGTPDSVRELPNASVDLGLALFALAERYGQKFGEPPPATEEQRAQMGPDLAKRSQEVDCAQRLVRIIAQDKKLPLRLRAQAYYLSGNLDFLRHDYEAAVQSYESALELIPAGALDAGDDVGERAAYNRAIAKKRAEEQKKEPPDPPDAGKPPPSDAGSDSQDDEQKQGEQNQDQDQQQDEQDPNQEQDEQKQDPDDSRQPKTPDDSQQPEQQPNAAGSAAPPPSAAPSSSAPTPSRPSLSQDEQILELLERAPMIQQEQPKTRGRVIGRSSMEDK